MIIAIDGTLASGKGTIARRLAAHFGLARMDTGLLYRATGVAAQQAGIALDNAARLAELASHVDPGAFEEAELRSAEASEAASRVAALAEVRAALFDLQRRFAVQPGGAILDGRDIGTAVCPEADVKLWVDAAVPVRAERRRKELQAAGQVIGADAMIRDLEARDARDRGRADAPMQAAPDAVLIDTTDMTIDGAVEYARSVVEAAMAAKGMGRS